LIVFGQALTKMCVCVCVCVCQQDRAEIQLKLTTLGSARYKEQDATLHSNKTPKTTDCNYKFL